MADYIELKDITRKHPNLTIQQILAVACLCNIRIRTGYATPVTSYKVALLEKRLTEIEKPNQQTPNIKPPKKESPPKPTVPPTPKTSKRVKPKKPLAITPNHKKQNNKKKLTDYQNYIPLYSAREMVPPMRTKRLPIHKETEYNANDEYIRKVLIGITLPLSSYDAIKSAVKYARERYLLDALLLERIYHHLANDTHLQKFFVDNVICRYVETDILTKKNGTENNADRFLLDIYKKQNNESALDILKPQEFLLDWKDVIFGDKRIRIMPPRTGNIKFAPLDVPNKMSTSFLNRLNEYLQRRLPRIRCIAKDNKLTLLDKIDLSPAIKYLKVRDVKTALDPETDGAKNTVPPHFAVNSLEEALVQADKYNQENLRKLKSQYINYLASLQADDYKVIPCTERVTHVSNDTDKMENAFIFTLAGNRPNKLILAVENINTARATMLFSFRRVYYDKILRGIFNYLRSCEYNKRSTLRTWERYGLNGIEIEYHAVNHRSDTHHYSWFETLKYRIKTM